MSKGKKKKSGNGAGAVAFGVTFVLLSSIFKIHGLFSLAVQLAVSAFVSAVIRTMAQGLDLTTDDQGNVSVRALATADIALRRPAAVVKATGVLAAAAGIA